MKRWLPPAAALMLAGCGEPPEPVSVDNGAEAMAANIEMMARNMEALASNSSNAASETLVINDSAAVANTF